MRDFKEKYFFISKIINVFNGKLRTILVARLKGLNVFNF